MRIRSSSDFQRSRRDGKSHGGRFLVLSVLALGDERSNSALPFRFGIILTRKVGNAVVRNRVRRRVRALLSKYGERIRPGHQLVVIARHTAPRASFEELERDWRKLLGRAGVLVVEKDA